MSTSASSRATPQAAAQSRRPKPQAAQQGCGAAERRAARLRTQLAEAEQATEAADFKSGRKARDLDPWLKRRSWCQPQVLVFGSINLPRWCMFFEQALDNREAKSRELLVVSYLALHMFQAQGSSPKFPIEHLRYIF